MSEMNDFNAKIIAEFRENGGKLGGQFEGAPMLLLHSKGAKSGEKRVNPMMYQEVDGGYAVFGSKGGAPTDPDWFHNLVANPDARAEVGTDTVDVKARVLDDSEREPVWTRQKELFPGFADYERQTSRKIPVVLLEPRT